MDQAASVLLDFPPAGGLTDDAQYHAAAVSHTQKLDKLAATSNFKGLAAQLLDVCATSSLDVWPCVNS